MEGSQQPARWGVLAGLAAASVVILLALMLPFLDLTPTGATPPQPTGPPRTATEPAALRDGVTTLPGGPGDALALVDHAHTAVIAPDHPATAATAGMVALYLRAPMLLVPTPEAGDAARAGSEAATARTDIAAAARERGLRRAVVVGEGVDDVVTGSGARDVVRVPAGDAAAPDAAAVLTAAGAPEPPGPATVDGVDLDPVRATRLAPPTATGVAVLVPPDAGDVLGSAVTARAVGHTVLTTAVDDLRADPSIGARLAQLGTPDDPPQLVLAGSALAGAAAGAVRRQAAVAMTEVQLPGGGQLVFPPGRRSRRTYVGLYGVPHSPVLGALGEQPVGDSVARAKRLARSYRRAVGGEIDIVPCFEIIATVASAGPGKDRNFSHEQPVGRLREAVHAAGEAGVYVLLDLQPGRTDFVTQARRYESLLREPHVGLALDPEWRLQRRQRHLEQIGSVPIDEVNAVVHWLADLVDRDHLPQKMLLLHQFRRSMLPDRERLDTSRDALAYVIQMDGQGPQSSKLETWRSVTADPPDNVRFGWKNFYDEDQPVRSPGGTMALDPTPAFVSYQ